MHLRLHLWRQIGRCLCRFFFNPRHWRGDLLRLLVVLVVLGQLKLVGESWRTIFQCQGIFVTGVKRLVFIQKRIFGVRIESLNRVAGVHVLWILLGIRLLRFFRARRVFSAPDPLVIVIMTAMSVWTVSALLATIMLSINVVVVVDVAWTANRHLTVYVVALNHLKLRVNVVGDKSTVHLSRHIHHWIAESQLDAIAGRPCLMIHQLISIHLLKVIILRRKVLMVVVEHVPMHVVILVVSERWSPLTSGMCEHYKVKASTSYCKTGIVGNSCSLRRWWHTKKKRNSNLRIEWAKTIITARRTFWAFMVFVQMFLIFYSNVLSINLGRWKIFFTIRLCCIKFYGSSAAD